MLKKQLILIGGGGHCVACIDVIEQVGDFKIAGIIDREEKVGETVLGYPIIGDDSDLESLSKSYDFFFITLGQTHSNAKRVALFDKLKSLKKQLPSIISPNAFVSSHAKIGEGSVVMHQAVVNAAAWIGTNCIINTGALIEHEAIIEKNSHVSTLAVVNGQCVVHENTFIGSNAVLNNNVSIAKNTIIGAGAVVLKDIIESGTYVGNPAKKIA